MTPPHPRVIHVAAGREWRGGERQVLLLAAGLQRAGMSQLVITARRSRLQVELEAAGVPCLPVRWAAALSPGALFAAVRAARTPRSLFHAHDPHALVVAGLAAQLTRAPLVVTRRVTFPLRRRGFWVRSDRIIAISSAVRSALISSGVDPSRIAVVNSAVDLDATRTTRPAPIRDQFGIPAESPVAISVAALTAEKDHLTLIDAAQALHSKHPTLHWLLVGEGPRRPALEAHITATGTGAFVHLAGWVENPLPFIAASSVFVSTSTDEGLGTSLLDAMALGVPVAASRVGGIPELLDGGAGLLTTPGSAQSTAEAVARILADRVARDALLERARETVARFDLAGMVEGVRSVYRSVVLER
ncbi:MAG: glycosyltransferase [Gemmatimonadales bacterium]